MHELPVPVSGRFNAENAAASTASGISTSPETPLMDIHRFRVVQTAMTSLALSALCEIARATSSRPAILTDWTCSITMSWDLARSSISFMLTLLTD